MRPLAFYTCILIGLRLCAQQTEVTNYDVDQGLPQSMVNHVVQDREGFLWFGTGDGLARFDGSRFTVYKHDASDSTSLGHNAIWGLAEAGDHGLWVGTRRGLDLLDRRTGRFKHIRTGPPQAKDGCWVSQWTAPGTALFYSPLLKEYLLLRHGRPQRIATQHEAAYAFAPAAPGAPLRFLVQPDSLITFNLKDGKMDLQHLPIHAGERVTDLEPVGDHWLVLTDRGGFLWKEGVERIALPSLLAAEVHLAPGSKYAARDPSGNLWLAITHAGVFRLNNKLEIAATYHFSKAARPFAITVITFDHQGNTWIGTDGHGVFKIAPQRIKFGRCMPGVSTGWSPTTWFVRGFAQWDTHRVLVWFHDSGPALFDERSATLSPLKLPGAAGLLRSVDRIAQDPDGIIWLDHRGTVMAVDPKNGGAVHPVEAMRGARLMKDGDGTTALLIANGLNRCRLVNGSIIHEAIAAPGLLQWMDSTHSGPARLFMDRQERIWAQPSDGAIRVWEKGALHAKHIDGLGVDVVMTDLVHGPDSTLWATTNNGLFAWNPSNLQHQRHITVQDGLADQYLYGFLPGPNGMLWITSNNGLTQYDPTTGTIRNYGTKDGLQSREFNTNALFTSASGLRYIGGINGFNYFRPQEVHPDPDIPQVAIVRITAQNQPWTMGPDSILVLPYQTNMVEVDLAVLEQSAPKLNSYRYRLAGYGSEWHTAPANRPILFTRLPAGRYDLEVVGINADGVESLPGRLLRIHVPLPFWASTWFFVALITAIIALVAWLLARHLRIGLQRKLEKTQQELKELRMRTRLAKEIHDDVGSGLARITALSRSPKRSTDADTRFEKLGEISGELMENLRDVVWMNDPHSGTLDALLLRIREHANDLFEGNATELHFPFPDAPPNQIIGGSFRRNLFLIAKEALQNAHKYSEASRITVEWHLAPDSFSFHVADNGLGVKEGVVMGSGHGTANMQQRAVEMQAKFERISAPGGGTIVRVTGPASCLEA